MKGYPKLIRRRLSPTIINRSKSTLSATSLTQSTWLVSAKMVWGCGTSRLIKSYSRSTRELPTQSREYSQPIATLFILTTKKSSSSLSKNMRPVNSQFMTYSMLQNLASTRYLRNLRESIFKSQTLASSSQLLMKLRPDKDRTNNSFWSWWMWKWRSEDQRESRLWQHYSKRESVRLKWKWIRLKLN